MLLALGRGAWWIASTNVPYGDETAHLGYVESFATGHGIPVTGRDATTAGAAGLENRSPTGFPDAGQAQYEGYQPPVYYIAMAPAYWLGRALDGELGALYMIRLATLLLAVAAVPLVSRLARTLFPNRATAPVVAPGILLTMELFGAQSSLVDNDGAMATLGACAFLAVLRARHGFTFRRGVFAGFVIGLALLTKPTALAELPLLLLAAIWLWHRRRPARGQLAKWAGGCVAAALVLIAPWLVYNLVEYHALTGAVADSRIVSGLVHDPPGWLRVRFLWDLTMRTLFVQQDNGSTPAGLSYRTAWMWTSIAIAVGGAVVAAVRGRFPSAVKLSGLTLALPLGTALLLAAVIAQSGAQAAISGRHLTVLLPGYCVLMAAAIEELLPAKPAGVAALALLSTSVAIELPVQHAAVKQVYEAGVLGSTAPVVGSIPPAGQVSASGITVAPACRPTGVAVETTRRPPPPATVDGRPVTPEPPAFSPWTTYVFPAPARGRGPAAEAGPAAGPDGRPVTLRFARPVTVYTGQVGRSVPASYVDPSGPGAPVALVYCRVADPAKRRFAELYDPMHPLRLTYRGLADWAAIQAVLDILAGVAIAGVWLAGSSGQEPDGGHRNQDTMMR